MRCRPRSSSHCRSSPGCRDDRAGGRRRRRGGPLPLDDLRPAVPRRDDQLRRSAGDRHPQADAAAQFGWTRDRLRRHRLCVPARLRDRLAVRRPGDGSLRHQARLRARARRLEPGGDGARRGRRASARRWPRVLGARRARRTRASVAGFIAARFALGLGESGNFPAAIKTVAEWFPKRERAFATGLFNSGTNIGAVVTPLVVPWITLHAAAGTGRSSRPARSGSSGWRRGGCCTRRRRRIRACRRAELALHPQRSARSARSRVPWTTLLQLSPDVGVRARRSS